MTRPYFSFSGPVQTSNPWCCGGRLRVRKRRSQCKQSCRRLDSAVCPPLPPLLLAVLAMLVLVHPKPVICHYCIIPLVPSSRRSPAPLARSLGISVLGGLAMKRRLRVWCLSQCCRPAASHALHEAGRRYLELLLHGPSRHGPWPSTIMPTVLHICSSSAQHASPAGRTVRLSSAILPRPSSEASRHGIPRSTLSTAGLFSHAIKL